MKKVFLFLAIALMSTALSAQQPYNGSFEHWYSVTNPDGWGTWATAVGQFNPVLGDSMVRFTRKDSLNTPGIYTGDTSSVRMTVDTITLPAQGKVTLAGFISLGGAFNAVYPDTPVGLRFGYYPYRQKPDSLIIDYKYVPVGLPDSALVVMTMIRFDSASQREVFYLDTSIVLTSTSSWAHISIPLVDFYKVHDTIAPDSIQIIVLSSIIASPQIGTTLWLDSLHFDASVNIIDTPLSINNISNLKGVTAYPNPTSDRIHVLVPQNEVGGGIALYDAEGREVYNATIDHADYIIHTDCLSDGIYTMRVLSTDRLTVYSGRISVLHRE
jgi:hypothetical protein